jgi:hypothetical protein
VARSRYHSQSSCRHVQPPLVIDLPSPLLIVDGGGRRPTYSHRHHHRCRSWRGGRGGLPLLLEVEALSLRVDP